MDVTAILMAVLLANTITLQYSQLPVTTLYCSHHIKSVLKHEFKNNMYYF